MNYERTCAEQCWNAVQDVCKCECGGARHGCLLVNGAPVPGRTRRVRDQRFRLFAVVTHEQARDALYHLNRSEQAHFGDQSIPANCKWPEVQGAAPWSRFIWVKAEVSEADAQREWDAALFANRATTINHHRRNCQNGVIYGDPCDKPEYHGALPDVDAWLAARRCRFCLANKHEAHWDDWDCHCECAEAA